MKNQVIENLTSSKNERLCFGVIWNETIGKGKGNTIILPEAFEKVGVTDKKRRNEAINRLAEKGLIFRARCDAHYYPHICNRYSVIKSGCKRFLEESEVMCE